MDDYLEVDLKKIIKNILKHWYWVVAPAIVVGIAVFLYSYLLLPDIYQANAIMIITDPRYVVDFVDDYETTDLPKPSASAIKTLSLSDDIITQLFDLWETDEKGSKTNEDLRRKLSIEASSNDMLFKLTVSAGDKQESAKLANAWVNLVIQKMNRDFFGFDTGIIDQFASDLSASKLKMDQAEAAVLAFIERDRRPLVSDRLSSLKTEQSKTFTKQRQLKEAKFDSLGILAQIEDQSDAEKLDYGLWLSYLLIQAKLTSVDTDIMMDTPVNSTSIFSFDLQSQEIEISTVGRFKSMGKNLIDVIDDQIMQLETEEASYIETINQLEAEIRSLNYEIGLLQADYDTYSDTYNIMLKQNEEVNLTMGMLGSGYAKLASQSAVPQERLPHNTVRNTLIGLVAGGFLGLGGVVISDWWRTKDQKEDQTA